MKNRISLLALFICIAIFPALAQLRSIGNDQITVIELAPNRDVWVGTTVGVSHYTAYPYTLITAFSTSSSLLQSDTISAIALGEINGNNYAFVGTPSGLTYIENGIAYAVPDSLVPETKVSAVFITPSDTLWVFSPDSGAVKIDSNGNYRAARNKRNTPFRRITCAQTSGCGAFIAGSLDSGAFYSTDYIHDTLLQAPNLVSDSVTAVAVSSNCNAYLVGTRNGFSFCPIGHGCQNYTSSSSTLPENYITAISQDCGGNIWLGMKDSGVVIFNPPTQAFIRVPMPDSLMQVTALAATTDSCTGINYIGTAGGYVTLVDSSHHVLQVTTSIQTVAANSMTVKVYPQPAANQVNFQMGTSLASGMISFSDLEGRVLNSFYLKNTDKFTLDISGIAEGLYLYTVSDDSQTLKTGKFEVLR